jgi:hypothetical protein
VSLVATWVQRGALSAGPAGRAAPAPATHDLDAATQVEGALAPLGDHARAAVELAALLGPDVDLEEWEAVLPPESTDRSAAVVVLEDLRLVEPTDRGFRFTPAACEAVRALARRHGRYDGLRRRAWAFLEARGRALRDAGRVVAASSVLGRAHALAESDAERLKVEARWVDALWQEGRNEPAAALAETARARPGGDPVDRAILEGHAANLCYGDGRWSEARAGWARAIEQHRAVGRDRSVRLHQRNLAVLDQVQGKLDVSAESLIALARAEEAAGDAAGAALSRARLTRTLLVGAQRVDGRRAAAARAAAAEATSGPLPPVAGLFLRTDLACLREDADGDAASALADYAEVLAALLDLGQVQAAAPVAGEWALISARRGRLDAAVAEISQYTDHVRVRSAGLLTRVAVDTLLALVRCAAGDWDGALAVARPTLEIVGRLGAATGTVDLHLVVARCEAGRGQEREAWAALAAAQERVDALGWTVASAEVAAVSGLVALRFGRAEAAALAEARARALCASGAALPHGAARRALADLEDARARS